MKKISVGALFVFAAMLSAQTETGGAPAGRLVTMVKINGGTFMMGSAEPENGRRKDEAAHFVTVAAFWMSPYEVTQREYQAVMGLNPSHFKGENLPVERVSWFDAVDFCNTLSILEGLAPVYVVDKQRVTVSAGANGYRLPTEAEWEYACRAGHSGAYSTGAIITTDQANYYGRKTTAAATFPPNDFGLYDMHGNVWEWCWDGYGVYGSAVAGQGSTCVVRGGSYRSIALDVRSAARGSSNAAYRSWDTGFRVARNIER
jgi:formylglycine-generating enzyme required for sulfatase activity